jgi:DNA-binding IclR family transcriptional regulator
MDRQERKSYYNRSLERALQILDAFDDDRPVRTRTRLAELLGLPRATVLRRCSTLVQYGYLKEDKEAREYRLGMRLFELGSTVFHSLSVRNAASRHIRDLQRRTGKTIFLAIHSNDQLLYIDKKEDTGENAISFTSKIGTSRPPFWGMCGPVLMAYLSEPEVERLLEKNPLRPYTAHSVTDKAEFRAWLSRVRELGYCVDPEATFEGITGVGAPVFDFSGRVVAAIGVAVFSFSADSVRLAAIIEEALKTALAISQDLGYKP